MRTALDAKTGRLDEAEEAFVGKIREHGWFRTGVFAEQDSPGFSYTTGFCVSASHPELIIFSMKDDIAHDVFWDMFRDAKSGKVSTPGKRTTEVFANLPAYAFEVAQKHYHGLLGWSRWFYGGNDFRCLQIVWPDRGGLFPWELGFAAEFAKDQPDLTERGWVNHLID